MKSDNDLATFIKDTYGSSCTFTRKPSGQPGVDSLTVVGDGKDLATSDCADDSANAIKYILARKQIVYWDMGQQATFMEGTEPGADVYDSDIVTSFQAL
jgi:hypothetical protein